MKYLTFCCSILLAVCALAVDKVTVKSKGFGTSYDAAIKSALKDAVRQVNGSAFRGDTTVKGSSSQVSVSANGVVSDDSKTTEDVTDDFREILKGVVLGHRVASCEPNAAGMYEAVLEVDVAKYTPPMADDRQKVAVAPLKYAFTGFQVGGDGQEAFRPAQLVTEELGSRMTTCIVQSGRFSVLSREDEDAIRSEEKVISENAPVTEMVKIGQRLGADFLVVGTLRNVYVSAPVSHKSQLTGMVSTSLGRASLSMTYRVIVVSTAQIAHMENIDIDLTPAELAACCGSSEYAFRTLLERAAQGVGYAFFTNFGKDVPRRQVPVAPSVDAQNTPQINVNVVVQPMPVQGGIRLPGDK
ncbi:MAG: hypothetical protein MJ240_03205 [Kiritimatiellae bacterium]|nr:hypothetical protein [Kiritimatiellia bacterium]